MYANGLGLRTLLPGADRELDGLALFEHAESAHVDVRVVDEDVLPIRHGDEAEALLGVEPLDGALGHLNLL